MQKIFKKMRWIIDCIGSIQTINWLFQLAFPNFAAIFGAVVIAIICFLKSLEWYWIFSAFVFFYCFIVWSIIGSIHLFQRIEIGRHPERVPNGDIYRWTKYGWVKIHEFELAGLGYQNKYDTKIKPITMEEFEKRSRECGVMHSDIKINSNDEFKINSGNSLEKKEMKFEMLSPGDAEGIWIFYEDGTHERAWPSTIVEKFGKTLAEMGGVKYATAKIIAEKVNRNKSEIQERNGKREKLVRAYIHVFRISGKKAIHINEEEVKKSGYKGPDDYDIDRITKEDLYRKYEVFGNVNW